MSEAKFYRGSIQKHLISFRIKKYVQLFFEQSSYEVNFQVVLQKMVYYKKLC